MKERKFIWSWKDPEHFEAHKKDFSRPMEEILEELESVLPATGERKAGTWYHEDFELSRSIGLSGLKVLFKREDPDEDTVFWAYRKGRSIPSQLALGKKSPPTASASGEHGQTGDLKYILSTPDARLPGRFTTPT